jgi:hypothetical protein
MAGWCWSGPVGAGPVEHPHCVRLLRGRGEQSLKFSLPVSAKMVLQIAVQDIGQLTDL